MEQFVYPARFTPDAQEGGFVVTFVDLPEAITQGETIEEAWQEATDCLEEAMANRIVTGVPYSTAFSHQTRAACCTSGGADGGESRAVYCSARRVDYQGGTSKAVTV
jgi:predicted RNase H-like HicB family nuclease